MELYTFYQMVAVFAMEYGKNPTSMMILSMFIGGAIWLALFLLQGFGLYKMAKNRGMKKKGLAFVPFANIYYIGKLAGDCNFFGQRVKRAGMYAMIMQIIVTVLCVSTAAAELYLYWNCGAPIFTSDMLLPYFNAVTAGEIFAEKFYKITSFYLLSIFELLYEIFLVILAMGLYKKYTPKNYMMLGILTLIFPFTRLIIIFALRNRPAIDYEAYMRARHEAYVRQQQEYYNRYGNPYNNPYGNGYNRPNGGYGAPYGQTPYNGPTAQPEDPFSEFDKSATDKNSTPNEGGDSDGFFD